MMQSLVIIAACISISIDVTVTKVRIKSDKQKNVAKLLADRRFRKMA